MLRFYSQDAVFVNQSFIMCNEQWILFYLAEDFEICTLSTLTYSKNKQDGIKDLFLSFTGRQKRAANGCTVGTAAAKAFLAIAGVVAGAAIGKVIL